MDYLKYDEREILKSNYSSIKAHINVKSFYSAFTVGVALGTINAILRSKSYSEVNKADNGYLDLYVMADFSKWLKEDRHEIRLDILSWTRAN